MEALDISNGGAAGPNGVSRFSSPAMPQTAGERPGDGMMLPGAAHEPPLSTADALVRVALFASQVGLYTASLRAPNSGRIRANA